jgi:hypothetical protein
MALARNWRVFRRMQAEAILVRRIEADPRMRKQLEV